MLLLSITYKVYFSHSKKVHRTFFHMHGNKKVQQSAGFKLLLHTIIHFLRNLK